VSIAVGALIVAATGGMGIFAGSQIATAWASTFATGLGAAVATGALAGAAGCTIMTGTIQGTLKGALFGAISAGVAYGIGETFGHAGGIFTKGVKVTKAFGKALAHGISRGAISMAQGGRYSGGFWSGFATSLLSPLVGSASTFEGKVAMEA